MMTEDTVARHRAGRGARLPHDTPATGSVTHGSVPSSIGGPVDDGTDPE